MFIVTSIIAVYSQIITNNYISLALLVLIWWQILSLMKVLSSIGFITQLLVNVM